MPNDLTIAELREQTANQMEIILQQSNEIDRLDKKINSGYIVFCLMCFVALIFGLIIIYK